jgi:NAD(P)H dehydrogenase (quinone)
MNIAVVFYSAYGHMYRMAQAAAEGAREVEGAEVKLLRVPETLPKEIQEKAGLIRGRRAFAHVPIARPEDLAEADAVIFGVPTRYGNMSGQMRQFLDSTLELWGRGALVGKVGSVMSSSATQHGGQETTIITTHITLLHHGMIIVGLPYSFQGQSRVDEITGGSPYGASTIAGPRGERMPSENELAAARYQGRWVAQITARLIGERAAQAQAGPSRRAA